MAHDCPDCGEYCTCDGEDFFHSEAPDYCEHCDPEGGEDLDDDFDDSDFDDPED